tara:strand:- start:5188 stop:5391 length:204 start_codon:yes stop_codon:yes gene_type:complete
MSERGFTIRIQTGMIIDYNYNLTEGAALRLARAPGVTIIETPKDWKEPRPQEPDRRPGSSPGGPGTS